MAGQELQCRVAPGPHLRALSLYDEADWLRAVLWVSAPLGPPVALVGKIFVQEGPSRDVFRLLHVRVPVEEAERFGKELVAEIIAASPGWAAEYELD